MITVIDYGSGNLRSVAKALESLTDAKVKVSDKAKKIEEAERLVLPGVGAFADCYGNLKSSGLLEPTLKHIESGKPFLGICVGMQLLFSESHEFGVHAGMDLIPGKVIPFATDMPDSEFQGRMLKVPHMGWNGVTQRSAGEGGVHPLWDGIPDGSFFYFVHSFHGQPDDAGVVAGVSEYGVPLTAAVARDNIFATQFHPEKSQKHGLRLLSNFLNWNP